MTSISAQELTVPVYYRYIGNFSNQEMKGIIGLQSNQPSKFQPGLIELLVPSGSLFNIYIEKQIDYLEFTNAIVHTLQLGDASLSISNAAYWCQAIPTKHEGPSLNLDIWTSGAHQKKDKFSLVEVGLDKPASQSVSQRKMLVTKLLATEAQIQLVEFKTEDISSRFAALPKQASESNLLFFSGHCFDGKDLATHVIIENDCMSHAFLVADTNTLTEFSRALGEILFEQLNSQSSLIQICSAAYYLFKYGNCSIDRVKKAIYFLSQDSNNVDQIAWKSILHYHFSISLAKELNDPLQWYWNNALQYINSPPILEITLRSLLIEIEVLLDLTDSALAPECRKWLEKAYIWSTASTTSFGLYEFKSNSAFNFFFKQQDKNSLSSVSLTPNSLQVESEAAPVYVQKLDAHGRAYATGKRKNAVARVWIKPGNGNITVNGREFETYFARPVLQLIIHQPILAAERKDQYDIVCTVKGGGLSGQAGAVRHGVSKALTYFEPDLRGVLKKGGFLTRDSRVVERKKYGRAKARKSFQFSKR